MPATDSRSEGLQRLAEQQLARWASMRAKNARPENCEVEEFVSISRGVGSGGNLVALELARRLEWPVFDREILHVLEIPGFQTKIGRNMTESDRQWLDSKISSITKSAFADSDYFHVLTRTVLALARQGSCVFVGRGADLILPRDVGLRIRIVANQETCVRNLASHKQITTAAALVVAEAMEKEQTDFMHRHFGIYQHDPIRFDLTINLDRVSSEQAVELIIELLRLRGLKIPL